MHDIRAIRENPAAFDAAKVTAMIDASTLDDATKTTLKAAVTAAAIASPVGLIQEMGEFIAGAGGKRLRPLLVYLAAPAGSPRAASTPPTASPRVIASRPAWARKAASSSCAA